MHDDAHYMALALEQAALAAQSGEVPVGAVVVKDGQVIGLGRNAPIAQHDPSAHAEIQALRAAAAALGNYRLDGCELFVTLEPCTMCTGAMLHARLQRVVFGALDAKTGAAGSVLNLFDIDQLNHQTQVLGGVLQEPCAEVLQTFFRAKRSLPPAAGVYPLRQDALRAPDACFADLADYPWQARYAQDLPALNGLRMHYLDEGSADAPRTYLCLHGPADWSYTYRHMVPVWLAAGHRVVAPDLVGFGKSDKPKRAQAHTHELHQQSLAELIERLELRNVVLLVEHTTAAVGLAVANTMPERFKRLVSIRLDETALQDPAYALPFPDAGHRAALRAVLTMGFDALPTSTSTLEVVDMGQLGNDNGAALAKAIETRCAAG